MPAKLSCAFSCLVLSAAFCFVAFIAHLCSGYRSIAVIFLCPAQQSLFGLGDPDTPVMEALIAGMAEVTLVCGQQITRGGATVGPDDVMHLIVQGQCAVMIDGETVATLGAGECIGLSRGCSCLVGMAL